MDITTISYQGKLRHGEEQMFRGAFLKMMGESASLLFHNHIGEGLRYSYPLIQYKVLDDSPTIVGIGEVGQSLMNLPKQCQLMIGTKARDYQLGKMSIEPYEPEISDAPKMYAIARYIPLNTANMEEFDSLPALTDRICFLENIINANVLAFFKGIGYHCDEEIHTAISSIDKRYDLYYKGVRFYGFDLRIITNVVIPDNVGLGKSSSVGFGIVRRIPIPAIYKAKLR
mgnify:CR=1 FL=1